MAAAVTNEEDYVHALSGMMNACMCPLFFVLARHLAHLLDQLGIGFRVGLLHVCWLVVCFAAAHHVWVTNTKRADYGRRIAQGGQRRHTRSASRTQTRAREQTMPAARAARSADLVFL